MVLAVRTAVDNIADVDADESTSVNGKKVAEALTQLADAENSPQRYGQTATARNSSATVSLPQNIGVVNADLQQNDGIGGADAFVDILLRKNRAEPSTTDNSTNRTGTVFGVPLYSPFLPICTAFPF